ncbi:alpha/beta hydrolase [Candidatus Leptofilum sp.]|uniref:alpha/beta hydrolase n=1 Tax=Candidatus Leptofilum sp. TaxID=3241576 RepID=UPI003B59B2EA
MNIFRRVLRWLFILGGIVAGLITAIAAFFAQRLIQPLRQPLWGTPDQLDMTYEDVTFPATDGVRLSGWFIPAPANSPRKGATLIMVHGWGWNRLGEAATDVVANMTGASQVDLLRLAHSLYKDGFGLLMYDGRNHGESGSQAPMQFGETEAQDVVGAIAYLQGRPEVAANRIGALGFSAGANTVLYALAETDEIQAAVAVQPTSPAHFAERFGVHQFGFLGRVILPLAELMFQQAGGRPLKEYRLGTAVAQAGQTPVLYIQGIDDPWGSPEDVQQMAIATPNPSGPLLVPGTDRYSGYQYLIDNPAIATAFFEQHLPE